MLNGQLRVRPKLRGLIHEIAFFVSLVTGPILVITSQAGARVETAAYSLAMSGLFGASSLYHRPNWRPAVRTWLGRLDHTMIFVLIAGTATPIALALDTAWANIMVVILWSAALLGVCLELVPIRLPRPVAVVPYLALGWLGLSLLPSTFTNLGVGTPILLLLGGLVYTFGAIVYARQSPDPRPEIFGYHEVFHAATVVAAYLHYAAVAVAVS